MIQFKTEIHMLHLLQGLCVKLLGYIWIMYLAVHLIVGLLIFILFETLSFLGTNRFFDNMEICFLHCLFLRECTEILWMSNSPGSLVLDILFGAFLLFWKAEGPLNSLTCKEDAAFHQALLHPLSERLMWLLFF